MLLKRNFLPFFLAFGFTLVAFAGFGQVEKSAKDLEADGKKRYGIESGRVKYEYSEKGSGTEMVHFDRWGWLEVRDVDMENSLLGNSFAQKRKVWLDGTQQVTHTTGSNYASASMERHLSTALQKASPAIPVLFGEEVIKAKNAKRKGRDEILGKSCSVWEIPNESVKVWVWKGIVLKHERKLLDKKIVMEATMIDEEWKPEKKVFELPEGLMGLPGSE